ncbi:MAG TPA: hypothetical protein VFB12_17885 [Ktedonobacteraceae bacterium]|nr:hypothetical protein [Ktedonobacteraceae bacterium]
MHFSTPIPDPGRSQGAYHAALAMLMAGGWSLLLALLSLCSFFVVLFSGITRIILGLFSLLLWALSYVSTDLSRAQCWVTTREVLRGR